MGGPTVAGFKRTFVLQLSCRCDSCPEKVQKHLKQKHGIGSILTDAAEGKVTISGSMIDPDMVITELKMLKINATLFSIVNDKRIALRKSEVPEGQKKVVLCKPTDIQSEHEHKPKRKSEVPEGQRKVVLCKPADIQPEHENKPKRKSEVPKGQRKVVLCKPADIQSEHEHKSERKSEVLGGQRKMVLCKPANIQPEHKHKPERKSVVPEGQRKVVLCKPADIQSEHEHKHERKSEVPEGQRKVVLCKPADIQSEHKHKLEPKNFDKRFTCNGCKEEGFTSRYRCEQCDYDLHHNCMFPKLTDSHELFEGSIFEFSNKRPIPTCGDRHCTAQVHMISCDACGNEIHGYFYHCKAKNLSLHPCCINLKSKLCIQGLTFSLTNTASSKCFWCDIKSEKGVNSGWSYVSKCENYQFHVKCIVQMVHEAWKKKVDEDDVYSGVLAKSLNMGLVRKSKRNGWSRGAKFVEMIILIARTIIGILFGDPIAIVAPIVVGLLKN